MEEKSIRLSYKMRLLAAKVFLEVNMWQCCLCGDVIGGEVKSCANCAATQNQCFGGLLIPGQDEESLAQLLQHYKTLKANKEKGKRTRHKGFLADKAKDTEAECFG